MKRWTVREGDGATVSAIVQRAGGDAAAIAEGRVFVGRRRAFRGDEPVAQGDQVSVAPARAEEALDVAILARRGDVVAVDKPAGLSTIADHGGSARTLVAEVTRLLGSGGARGGPRGSAEAGGARGRAGGGRGEAERAAPHPTSRLDREVSGVVVFALTRSARLSLERARDEGRYVRRYVAIAARAPSPDRGVWDAPIGRGADPRHRAAFGREAAPARTAYRVVARAGRRRGAPTSSASTRATPARRSSAT